MRIIRDDQAGTWTLVPVTENELGFVQFVVTNAEPDELLIYTGRVSAQEGYVPVRFVFRTTEFVLSGTEEADQLQVHAIRKTCYYATGGMLYLDATAVDGLAAIVVTGEHCKHCGHPIVDTSACQYSTCDQCAEKCEHDYSWSAALGMQCEKCGRPKPGVSPEYAGFSADELGLSRLPAE